MKKFFPLLLILLLTASSLLAQEASLRPDVPTEITAFGNVTVQWAFVNALPRENNPSGAINYNAIITITNYNQYELSGWRLEVEGENATYTNCGASFYREGDKNIFTGASIPAMGTITIPYSALSYGDIIAPKRFSFLSLATTLDWNP